MKRLRIITLLFLAATLTSATTSTASDPQKYPDVLANAELICEVESVQPGRPFTVALRFTMRDGWHINWLNPGDAGLAPSVVWTLPESLDVGDLQWPYPERIDLPEISMFGYGGEILLLSEMTPPADLKPGVPIEVKAKVNWLACREVCIPGGADLTLMLPVTAAVPEKAAKWEGPFERARAMLPVRATEWHFSAKLTGNHISILAYPPERHTVDLARVIFFPKTPGVIENAASQTLRRSGTYFRVDIERARMGEVELDRLRGILVSDTGWGSGTPKALEIDVRIEQ